MVTFVHTKKVGYSSQILKYSACKVADRPLSPLTNAMAQPPSNATPYTFSARVLIQPNVVTNLPYAAPVAANVSNDALTITRCFYDG